ncbi:hypothetical protein PH552_12135 [Rhizobium sp. CNPSo 3968]|uniref:hypothetical protein n=1 Tax=Rhizobium sp. CNPSo 3968 TaxID=3021408 RepID=UPI00254BB7E7|nr:hypothetical protein [Rhizobium sp. CNPSo 3968]MDK4720093.1 hypothetical protein [Rhizobium sp. CNPSo 3968]
MMADICIIKQFGCSCPSGECEDQARHQRIADLFARERAARESHFRRSMKVNFAICLISAIVLTGIFYAAGSSADDGFRKKALIDQESSVHVARR